MESSGPMARLFCLAAFFLLCPALATRAAATTQTVTVTAAATGPSGSASEFADDGRFIAAVLNSTNTFRAQHGAANVSYNATLAAFAAGYLAGDGCHFAHSGGPFGENLAIGCTDGGGGGPGACVELWGRERDHYNFSRPGFSEATGHFTQLVWKNTTAVGCGRRACGGGRGQARSWFLVCEYWPRGNVIGQFGDQVGRRVSAAVALPADAGPRAVAWTAIVALVLGLV